MWHIAWLNICHFFVQIIDVWSPFSDWFISRPIITWSIVAPSSSYWTLIGVASFTNESLGRILLCPQEGLLSLESQEVLSLSHFDVAQLKAKRRSFIMIQNEYADIHSSLLFD